MSFDDYANHIYQKHRLAVALAILKSKPKNLDPTQYLEELKSKIDDKMDDDDVTICSDDFLIDDDDDEMNDSVTILKDFLPGDQNEVLFKEFGDDIIDGLNNERLSQELTQTTFYDSQIDNTPNIVEPLNNSIMITEENNNPNHFIDTELSLPHNKDRENDENSPNNNSGHNYCASDKFSNISQYNANEYTNSDNKPYGIGDKANNSKVRAGNSRKEYINQNIPYGIDSKVSNSEAIPGYSYKESANQNKPYKIGDKVNNSKAVDAYSNGESVNKNNSYSIENKALSSDGLDASDHTKSISKSKPYLTENKAPNSEAIGKDKLIDQDMNENSKSTYYDSQKTISYTLHGYTQNYTHYSPSQTDIIIPNKYIYGGNNKINNKIENKEVNNIINNINPETFDEFGKDIASVRNNDSEFEFSQTMDVFSQNNDGDFHENQNNFGIVHPNNNKNVKSAPNSQNVDAYFDVMQNIKDNLNNSFPLKNIKEQNFMYTETDLNNEFNKNNDGFSQTDINKDTDATITALSELEKNKNENHNSENSDKNDQITSKNDFQKENQEEYGEITSVQDHNSEEIISYKVLEEFNKVKTFLKKPHRRMSCDGYSTDSGYRSDSQLWSSNRSALQLSGNWLNQSGCCLFNYIMQCPLVAATRDITNEIAQVLSELIDKLHDEEKYPSFLEELLDTVDLLLRQLYEGVSSGESEFLKKDEVIQRLLLLNKSIHIQKHSIEKISNILENFHSKITEIDSTFELSNVDEIENVSYIFHVLEILLKKYLKNKELLSQTSTQASQEEEKIFKKSSIADIWRKKWNPSQKVFEGSREKKCVMKMCSEILNKIVVECVSCYSLVAFSALKCFNCMQC